MLSTRPLKKRLFAAHPQRVAAHFERRLAVGALDVALGLEPLDAEDVAEEEAVVGAAVGARPLGDERVLEEDLLREVLRDRHDQGRPDEERDQRVEAPARGDELVRAAGPEQREDRDGGQVEHEAAEAVGRERDLCGKPISSAPRHLDVV